jgi:hypothetical protein
MAFHDWLALVLHRGSDIRLLFELPEFLKSALEKKIMKIAAQFKT